MGKNLRCPVCQKSLTQKEYQRALNIVELQSQDMEKLKKQLGETKVQAKKAKTEGIRIGKERTKRLFKGKEKTIEVLRQRLQQLQKDKTPQDEGFRFERTFERDLKRLFGEEDEIVRKGKEGDILQIVMVGKEVAGKIIYELKKTTDIKEDYIQQTHTAKQEQGAHFAVMVTSGKKRGFDGLAESEGIFIVAPVGAMALASLLRMHLIAMLRSKISQQRREDMARKLVNYINSPLFRNPILDVVKQSNDLQKSLKSEAKTHFKIWRKRWTHYQTINWNIQEIHANIQNVMSGKEPKEIRVVKENPLYLIPEND